MKESRHQHQDLVHQYQDIVNQKHSSLKLKRELQLKEEKEDLRHNYKIMAHNQHNNSKYLKNAYNDLKNDWKQNIQKKEVILNIITL